MCWYYILYIAGMQKVLFRVWCRHQAMEVWQWNSMGWSGARKLSPYITSLEHRGKLPSIYIHVIMKQCMYIVSCLQMPLSWVCWSVSNKTRNFSSFKLIDSMNYFFLVSLIVFKYFHSFGYACYLVSLTFCIYNYRKHVNIVVLQQQNENLHYTWNWSQQRTACSEPGPLWFRKKHIKKSLE